MKIFISSDMEGTAGVVDWDQCRPGQQDYELFRRLLQDEVNAAIDGANQAGGPHEFLVNDSHGRMANLFPERLNGEAAYLSGRHKPLYMMQGLDESFDAIFFLSYHGSASGGPATLSHTYNPAAIAEVRLNGTLAGESGINSLVALGYGVPVVLVTGDQTTASEIGPFWPEARTAVVKQSISRFAAESLHPARATRLIASAAREAVESLRGSAKPTAHIELPATLTVRLRNPDLAEQASWLERVERDRDDPVLVHLVDDDPIRLYRTFRHPGHAHPRHRRVTNAGGRSGRRVRSSVSPQEPPRLRPVGSTRAGGGRCRSDVWLHTAPCGKPAGVLDGSSIGYLDAR